MIEANVNAKGKRKEKKKSYYRVIEEFFGRRTPWKELKVSPPKKISDEALHQLGWSKSDVEKLLRSGVLVDYSSAQWLDSKINEPENIVSEGLLNTTIKEKDPNNKPTIKEDEEIIEPLPTLNEILKNGVKERVWNVKNILTENGITIFGGTAGSYKTWAGMHLALCLATGRHFLEEFKTRKCRVLYIDEENGNQTIHNRFSLLVKGMGITEPLDNINISVFNDIVFDNAESLRKLSKYVETHNPDVVVVDSMVRCLEGDENKARDVKAVFSSLKTFLERDIAFIILHHTVKKGKGTMGSLRGSGDFAAFAEVVLMFNGWNNGICYVSVEKNRHTEPGEKFSFKLTEQEKGGYNLEYSKKTIAKSLLDDCKELIIDWIDENGFETFRTKHILDYAMKNGFKKSVINSSLKNLIEEDKLSKVKTGVWATKK